MMFRRQSNSPEFILGTEGGGFDRSFPTGSYLRPTVVHVDGDELVWKTYSVEKSAYPAANLLTSFLQLRNAKPDKVFEFSKQHGVLGYCKCGRSYMHAPDRGCVFSGDEVFGFRESIADWIKTAQNFWTLVKIAARLHEGEFAEREHWEAVLGTFEEQMAGLLVDDNPDEKQMAGLLVDDNREAEYKFMRQKFEKRYTRFLRSIEHQRWALASILGDLIDEADIRPTMRWANEEPSLVLGNRDSSLMFLFGPLVVQLFMVVSRSETFAICSNCGEPFTPRRRPNPRYRTYCRSCQETGARERYASHQYRRRKGKGGRDGS